MSERPVDAAREQVELALTWVPADYRAAALEALAALLDALEAAEHERDKQIRTAEFHKKHAAKSEARVVLLKAQLAAQRDVIHAAINDLRTELRVLAEVNARAAAVSVADSGPAPEEKP